MKKRHLSNNTNFPNAADERNFMTFVVFLINLTKVYIPELQEESVQQLIRISIEWSNQIIDFSKIVNSRNFRK